MSKETILIVDDDSYVRQGTRLRLRASGFETLMAADVMTTLSKAEIHHPDVPVDNAEFLGAIRHALGISTPSVGHGQ
jgi:CheY-like chemotaxis protein